MIINRYVIYILKSKHTRKKEENKNGKMTQLFIALLLQTIYFIFIVLELN